ncbi:hypothetical protein [Luteibacter sp.]|uniref:hypothetical protein n=1 Tax=Luteibacter sp. TaxID=1886636 RepID=UPI003F7FF58F
MKDFLEFLSQSIAGLVGGGIAAAIVIWLAKTTIAVRVAEAVKGEYAKDLATHKDKLKRESDALGDKLRDDLKATTDSRIEVLRHDLKAKSDVELARLTAQLSIEAAERQVHVAGLYDRRADALVAIYALLTDLKDALRAYVSVFEMTGGPTKEDLRMKAAAAYNSFTAGYKPLLVLVPKPTAVSLRDIEAKARSTYNKFFYMVQLHGSTNAAYEEWGKLSDFVDTTIEAAMEGLEDDFRMMLSGRLDAGVVPSGVP